MVGERRENDLSCVYASVSNGSESRERLVGDSVEKALTLSDHVFCFHAGEKADTSGLV